MFDWIVTRNAAVERIHTNVFENEKAEAAFPIAIDRARKRFYEFCLFVLCDEGDEDHHPQVVELVKRTRSLLQTNYADELFVLQTHAAFWLRFVIREQTIVSEIQDEIASRAFLSTLSFEMKTAWLIRCGTSDLPDTYKRRISPVTTPFQKHADWIEERVGDVSTIDLLVNRASPN